MRHRAVWKAVSEKPILPFVGKCLCPHHLVKGSKDSRSIPNIGGPRQLEMLSMPTGTESTFKEGTLDHASSAPQLFSGRQLEDVSRVVSASEVAPEIFRVQHDEVACLSVEQRGEFE